MTGFPGAPIVMKGALVSLDPITGLPGLIAFQYNPDSLTRTLARSAESGEARRHGPVPIGAPPKERIELELELDAVDRLARGERGTHIGGDIAALELLLYPRSTAILANLVNAALGMIEITPPAAPLVLFVWGRRRVLPVHISEMTITEKAFDPDLNPIRASVSLSMDVLNYDELGVSSVGGSFLFAHHLGKELEGKARQVSGLGSVFTVLRPGGI